MSGLTDEFDMILQFKEDVLNKIFQARHRASIIDHKLIRALNGKRINLVMNVPRITITDEFRENEDHHHPRAIMTSRVFYHSRLLSDIRDLGSGAVADVNVKVKLGLSGGNPCLLTHTNGRTTKLIVDWRETQRDDIIVYNVPPEFQNEVKDVLIELLKETELYLFSIPNLESQEVSIGSIGFRFLSNSGSRAVSVGMNDSSLVKGNVANLHEIVLQQDWALILSKDYVLAKIRENLENSFPLPYRLYHDCTMNAPWPFKGCWNWTTIELTELEVDLKSGYIEINGKITIENSGSLIPSFPSYFTCVIYLSIGSDQKLQITIGDIDVVYEDNIATFFYGDTLKESIENGVRNALGSSSGTIPDFFDPQMLSEIASTGSTTELDITLTSNYVNIRPDALIIHGVVNVVNTDTPPIASYITVLSEPDPGPPLRLRKIYHAGDSWAPGGQIVKYKWDFFSSNGPLPQVETIEFEGTNARFVIERFEPIPIIDPISGTYIYGPCLTVTDNKGRTDTICPTVCIVPPLDIDILAPFGISVSSGLISWEIPMISEPFNLTLSVTSNGNPVSDVLIRISGKDCKIEQNSNQIGQVTFQLKPTAFEQLDINQKKNLKLFEHGRIRVEAIKKDYRNLNRYICMMQTEERSAFINRVKKRIDELKKRISRIVSSYIAPINQKMEIRRAEPPCQRFKKKIDELLLTAEIIMRITQLFEEGSDLLPSILQLDAENGKFKSPIARAKNFEKNFFTLLKRLDSSIDEFSKEISRGSSPAVININKARDCDLERSFGLDSEIVNLIKKHRPIANIDQLTKITGLDKKKLSEIKNRILF